MRIIKLGRSNSHNITKGRVTTLLSLPDVKMWSVADRRDLWWGENSKSKSFFRRVLGKTRRGLRLGIDVYFQNTPGQGGSGVGQRDASEVWQTAGLRAVITTLVWIPRLQSEQGKEDKQDQKDLLKLPLYRALNFHPVMCSLWKLRFNWTSLVEVEDENELIQ